RSGLPASKKAATGSRRSSSTTRPAGRCRAASTSARRAACRISRTATTATSTRTSAPGTSTSAATCGSARPPTPTPTAPPPAGCPYAEGRTAGGLPRGEVLVDVARGFEYEPLRQAVTIEPGQRHLELRLKRWTNMNARRWFSGDTHVHFLSTQGSQREAQGED